MTNAELAQLVDAKIREYFTVPTREYVRNAILAYDPQAPRKCEALFSLVGREFHPLEWRIEFLPPDYAGDHWEKEFLHGEDASCPACGQRVSTHAGRRNAY